jgi:hypothetical protein
MKLLDLTAPPKHYWPRSLQRIEQWCGDEVAIKLWKSYPGVHVHIPKSITAEHPLVAVIGLQAATILSDLCGGENLLIAKAHKAQLALRNFAIRRARREGKSLSELALSYELCERQVMAICNADALVPVSTQIDLFADLNEDG